MTAIPNFNAAGVSSTSSSPADTGAQLGRQIAATNAAADAQTVRSVKSLQLIHQSRVSQLTRNVTTLTKQYGATDARTQAAQSSLSAAAATAASTAVVSRQLSTPAPAVSSTGWTLHGRVYDASLNPAAQQTVFLVDAQKNYQQQYGFAYTDSTGYFVIANTGSGSVSSGSASSGSATGSAPGTTSTPASVSGGTDNAAIGVESSSPSGSESSSPSGTTGSGSTGAGNALYVEVANAKGEPVYIAAAAFQPATGSVTYQNHTLPAGGQPIGDPPAAVRSSALPNQEAQKGTQK